MERVDDAPSRVCVFSRIPRPGVGDLVQTNVFLHLLRRAYPRAAISWVVGAYVTEFPFEHDMVRRHSYADEVIVCPDAEDDSPARWSAFTAKLSQRRFGVCVVDPRSLGLGVPEAHRAGIATRVAVPKGQPGDALITHPMRLRRTGPDGPDLYDYAAALAAALGVALDPRPDRLIPRLALRPEPLPAWSADRPFVGLHPGCSSGWSRRWPLASYTELAARLVAQAHATVLVLGGQDEEVEAELLRNGVLDRCPGAAVHTCLGESVNRVANLIDRMDLLVGNDSGLAHLAAALSTPSVVVYGPADGEALWKRVYPLHLGVNKHYPCQRRHNGPNEWDGQCALGCPCDYVAPEGPYPKCLSDITVDEVWHAALAQLSQSRRPVRQPG